jgi:uncharacterized protein YuzE
MSSTFLDLPPVSLTVDDTAFDRYHYDEEADTLCFHTGPGKVAVDVDETVEDHLLRFDGAGDLLSLAILNARLVLERDGAIEVTLRDGGPTTRLQREVVEPLLVEPPR